MTRKFYLQDSTDIFYPVAHALATYDSDGNTVQARLNEIDTNETTIQTKINELETNTSTIQTTLNSVETKINNNFAYQTTEPTTLVSNMIWIE